MLTLLLVLFAVCLDVSNAFNNVRPQTFPSLLPFDERPKLILISGCSGTGKSTFGMSVALDHGILSCISTETFKYVMQSFIDPSISPPLYRSASFEPARQNIGPVKSWRESCTVLKHSVENLVEETIKRGDSLVVEGVHLIPSRELIEKWESNGGVAQGFLLTVSNEQTHKNMLLKRGTLTGQNQEEDCKAFQRVRLIQDEMIRLANEADWMVKDHNLLPGPLETIGSDLWSKEEIGWSPAKNKPKKRRKKTRILEVYNSSPYSIMVDQPASKGKLPTSVTTKSTKKIRSWNR